MSFGIGKDALVKKGSNNVLGIGKWTVTGGQNRLVEISSFGDQVDKHDFSTFDPGTVQFDGLSDPDDTNGQVALETAFNAQTALTDLYFYYTATKFLAVDVGGSILLTEIGPFDVDRNGLKKVSFKGQVSGAKMARFGS